MTPADNIQVWRELMALVSKYDWSVETDLQEHDGIIRKIAQELRNKLITLSKEY